MFVIKGVVIGGLKDRSPIWHRNENDVISLYFQYFIKNTVWFKMDEHYHNVMMSVMAYQITSRTIVYSAVYSGTDQSKHQSSASLAFVRGNHRWPVNSPHKGPVTRKIFPFDDVIMNGWRWMHHQHSWHSSIYEEITGVIITIFLQNAWRVMETP